MRKAFWIILIVLAAAGIWLAVSGRTEKSLPAPAGSAIGVGSRLPAFTLTGLKGENVEIGRSGKITVLNFWATWCPPCRAEMPELQGFAEVNASSVDFYAVNIQEQAAKVSSFMEQNQYKLPVLLDTDGKVSAAFRITSIPTTVIADKNGTVKFRKSGGVTASELQEIIKDL